MLKIEIHQLNGYELTCYQVDIPKLRDNPDRYKGWKVPDKEIIFTVPAYSSDHVNIITAGRLTVAKHGYWFVWIDETRICIMSDAMYRAIFPNTETISNGSESE